MAIIWSFKFNYLCYPESNYKKEDFCGFEPTKMHCEFMHITNAFQIRFYVISNALGNKGDHISI